MEGPSNTLWPSIQAGDEAAFRQIFNQHYRTLLGTAINLLKDPSAAKDVVQDTFLHIWNKRHSLDIQGEPGAYLKRAVINRCLNHLKARKDFVRAESLTQQESPTPNAEQQLAGADIRQALDTALSQLPERCRLVFTLRRMEGLALKEIARQLDISPKTVENQMTKALKHLQNALRPFTEGEK